jgi:hypothetical protein
VEVDVGNDGLWKARKTIKPFSALPTNLGNRYDRFPHSHRHDDYEDIYEKDQNPKDLRLRDKRPQFTARRISYPSSG